MGQKNKRAFEMSFNWIFAMLAGGFILFLAIFAANRFTDIGQEVLYTETSASLVALLDPFETGLASSKSDIINFQKESKVIFTCSYKDNRPFGRQRISFAEKKGKEFTEPGGEFPVNNKYVFAENEVEGKQLKIFSKPFFMGYKVADLIVIFSQDYCFYQAPNDISEELSNIPGVFLTKNLNNCTGKKIVCFDSEDSKCNIKIIGSCTGFECKNLYESGKVIKGSKEIYFTNNLIYPAIFSSPEIYECNLKRLMSKFKELGEVYIGKIAIIENSGCSSQIEPDLRILISSTENLESSRDLAGIVNLASDMNIKNGGVSSECRLY